jgi:hypothetical protein
LNVVSPLIAASDTMKVCAKVDCLPRPKASRLSGRCEVCGPTGVGSRLNSASVSETTPTFMNQSPTTGKSPFTRFWL